MKLKIPDLEGLSYRFVEENYLEMSQQVQQPKILLAMEIAADVTAEYYNERLKLLEKELRKLREKGDKPQ